MKKSILFLALTSIFSVALSSCQKEEKKHEPINYDYKYFNGICALSGEFNNGVDIGLTNDWTASRVKALGAKSMRLWIALSGLFTVGEEDDLHINMKYYNVMKDHIDKLKAVGVENFLCMYSAFVYPTGYVPSTGYVVPDPREEYEDYLRFLHLQEEASKQIITLFPEIKNFEPGNEPDFACPGCIHKNGFIYGGDMTINYPYVYNDDDKASIIDDLCWYVRRGVTSVDSKAKVAIPGLTNQGTTADFLDLLYQKIESKRLPAGQEFSDTNPDRYFDILNWHPYPTQFDYEGNIDWADWTEYNRELYQVAIDHNDEGKEVYFSELGWTDFGINDESTLNRIAKNYENAFKCIKEDMPFVTAVFAFRMTNLKYQVLDDTGGEENFGLFYHPDDDVHHGGAKPAAYVVAKVYNGEDYNLDEYLK